MRFSSGLLAMATAAAGTNTAVSSNLMQFSGQSLDYEAFAQIEADLVFSIKVTWPSRKKKSVGSKRTTMRRRAGQKTKKLPPKGGWRINLMSVNFGSSFGGLAQIVESESDQMDVFDDYTQDPEYKDGYAAGIKIAEEFDDASEVF